MNTEKIIETAEEKLIMRQDNIAHGLHIIEA